MLLQLNTNALYTVHGTSICTAQLWIWYKVMKIDVVRAFLNGGKWTAASKDAVLFYHYQ